VDDLGRPQGERGGLGSGEADPELRSGRPGRARDHLERVAFGGMAATPKRASHTEAALEGKPWTETTLRAARAALATDYTPLTDMRATAAYRMQVAQNLLERFYLETRPGHPLPAASVSVFATA